MVYVVAQKVKTVPRANGALGSNGDTATTPLSVRRCEPRDDDGATRRRQEQQSHTEEIPLSLSFLYKKKRGSQVEEEETQQLAQPSPTRLVRKKSGEMVKSSLRLNSLAGGNSKSMPTTPTYNKSVHFGADVDVRYFDEREKPTAVSADGSPLLHGRTRMIGNASFEGLANMSETDDDDDDDDDDDVGLTTTWDLVQVNFSKIKYNDKFREGSKIFLEKLILDDEAACIVGSIAVKNLSFQKDVHVRYSFDQWRTVIEIEAGFTDEAIRILKRANFDRFSFKIPLKKFEFLPNDKTEISFCIRYRYNKEELWDNNSFKNYKVILTRVRRQRGSRSTKFSLNDYLNSDNHFVASATSHNGEATSDYFGNYETFMSPEMPKVLRMEDSGSNILDTPDFSSLDNITQSVTQMSLLSDNDNSNAALLDCQYNKENKPMDPLTEDSRALELSRAGPIRKNKPAMNSKSYQELLDSYCFFTSGDHQ